MKNKRFLFDRHHVRKTQPKSGFTLIELLVVISIIGLLASVVLVSVSQAKEKARIVPILAFERDVNTKLLAKDAGSLVANYTFDEITADTLLDDGQVLASQGFGKTLTVNGSGLSVVSGPSGKAIDFNGTSAILEGPEDPTTDFGSDDFTISLWVRSGIKQHQIAVRKGGDMRFVIWPVRLGSETTRFEIKGSGTDKKAVGVTKITDGRWHHILMMRRENCLYLYVDAQVESSPVCVADNLNINDENSTLVIGGQGYPMRGSIDNVRLYNTAIKI